MSTKIYREVTSKFNDKTHKWETIHEDSYDYEGPVDLAQGEGGFDEEDFRDLKEIFKDISKTFEKAMKKAVTSGASSYKKAFISAGSSVNDAIQKEQKQIEEAGIGSAAKSYLNSLEAFQAGLISADEFADAGRAFDTALKESNIDETIAEGIGKGITIATDAAHLQEAHNNIREAFSEGIQDGLGILPSNTFTKILGIDSAAESATKALSDKLAPMLTGIGEWMGKHWGVALGIGMVFAVIGAISSITDEIGEEFGAIGVQEFNSQLVGAKATAASLGYEFSDVADSVNQMTDNFGIAFDDAIKISHASMDTARALGISTDQAAELTGLLMQMGQHSAESAQNFMKQGAALAKSAGVSPSAVMSDIAGSSEEVAGYMKDSGENIMQAAVGARKMGMNLGEVVAMADSLLDFQTSIESEMTASVMIGKNLNLQKARELALEGKLKEMTEEILDNVVSESEWNALNVLQRKAMADALGLSVQSMSKMVDEAGKTYQQLKAMRELDISEIVSEDALSKISVFMNNLKAIGLWFLSGISWMTDWFSGMGEGWDMVGTAVTLFLGLLVILGVVMLGTYIKSIAVASGMKAAGVSSRFASIGLSAFAKAGVAATPGLIALSAAAWSLSLAMWAMVLPLIVMGVVIGGVLMLLIPIINAIASGIALIITSIVDGIVRLASSDTILGVIGLAGAFYMLASAMVMLGTAGFLAMPVIKGIAGVAAVGLGMAALGDWLFGGDADEIKWTELKQEIQEVKTAVNKIFAPETTLNVKIKEGV
jgi:hypothetical protein